MPKAEALREAESEVTHGQRKAISSGVGTYPRRSWMERGVWKQPRLRGGGAVEPTGSSAWTAEAYFSQDADGTLFSHGVSVDTDVPGDPDTVFIDSPEGKVTSMPSPVTLGATFERTAQMSFGATPGMLSSSVEGTWTETVVATEYIRVPAGDFVAAKLEGSSTGSMEGVTVSGEMVRWFVPEIGTVVRGEQTIRSSEGSLVFTQRSVMELTETNVPYSGDNISDDDPPSLTTEFVRILEPGDSWTHQAQTEMTADGLRATGVGTAVTTVLPETVVDLAGNTARVMRFQGDTVVTLH